MYVLAFGDDIFIHNNTWKEHLHHFKYVLSILEENSLYAKLSKFEFGMMELLYLVHVIVNMGLMPT